MTISLSDVMIAGKKASEVLSSELSGDPWTDTAAAYELLKLSNHFIYGPLRNLNLYQMVEIGLRKKYRSHITGIAPESQQDKDIENISLLDALMFFRELGWEAESITSIVNNIWESIAVKEKYDTEVNEGITLLLEQAKEGNELAKIAVNLLRKSYRAEIDS